jgi:hypothetical protein
MREGAAASERARVRGQRDAHFRTHLLAEQRVLAHSNLVHGKSLYDAL